MSRILFYATGIILFAGYLHVSLSFAEDLLLEEIQVRGRKESAMEESLTIREVRESPARDLGEALKQVEGIDIVRKGAIASDVVLRGLQRDNINVLVDGVKLYGGCPNRMDPPAFHIDFALTEQINIIKGPYDLENAGSMGGLIDVKTKSPGKGLRGDLGFTYGSYDMINASGTVSHGTDKFDGLLGYAYKYSLPPRSGDGKRITAIYPEGNPNRYRPDAIDSRAYSINTGWTKLGFNPTADSRTELMYSYQDADHVLYPYLLMDADFDRTHLLNWTYHKENISSIFKALDLQAYWNRVDHLMDDRFRVSSLGTPDNFSMRTDAFSQVIGGKMKGALAVGPGLLKAGLDFYSRNWDATNIMFNKTSGMLKEQAMIPDVTVDNLGIFSEYTLPLAEKLEVRGGVRGDLTMVEADRLDAGRIALFKGYYGTAPDSDREFGEVSGNLQFAFKPMNEMELILGLAQGVRTPDPQELYISLTRMSSNLIGNPHLRPTRNSQVDFGIKYFTDRLYANATIFYSYLHNFINVTDLADPDGAGPLITARSYRNVNAGLWGAEFGSQLALPLNLYLKGALSYVEGENLTEDRPLSEIPPLKGTAGLRYDIDSFFFEISENFAVAQDRVDPALQENTTPGWLTTDLKAGVNWKWLTVYGGVYNLFDKFYYSHLSYQRDPFKSGLKVPENGRNFYLTLAGRF